MTGSIWLVWYLRETCQLHKSRAARRTQNVRKKSLFKMAHNLHPYFSRYRKTLLFISIIILVETMAYRPKYKCRNGFCTQPFSKPVPTIRRKAFNNAPNTKPIFVPRKKSLLELLLFKGWWHKNKTTCIVRYWRFLPLWWVCHCLIRTLCLFFQWDCRKFRHVSFRKPHVFHLTYSVWSQW